MKHGDFPSFFVNVYQRVYFAVYHGGLMPWDWETKRIAEAADINRIIQPTWICGKTRKHRDVLLHVFLPPVFFDNCKKLETGTVYRYRQVKPDVG